MARRKKADLFSEYLVFEYADTHRAGLSLWLNMVKISAGGLMNETNEAEPARYKPSSCNWPVTF